MKNKSIKKNFIYNSILTSANIVFPLITAPYLSYTLGADNIGKVNFATSLVNWFILISAFGIPRYGIREIARNRDNKEDLSNTFWNLILIQACLTIISIALYLLVIFNAPRFENQLNIHLIMTLMLVLNVFSIDWFYQGIEEYSYITIRNIAFKIISIILMFFMVKNSDDYIIFAGINIFGLCFNNVLNYLHTKKYIYKKIYKLETLKYLKELRIYFLTTLIIALYTQLDQLFIGYGSEQHLAFYLRSKTILGIGMSITNSIVTVLVPRTAYLMKHNFEEYKKIVSQSINYIYIIGLPCVVGIFLLSKEVMLFLGGEEFVPASYSLQIISILVVVNSIGTWQVNQILIPYRKEKIAFNIQCIAAVISVVLNIVLVPKLSFIGAAIAWFITELMLVFMEGIAIKKVCKDIKIEYITLSFKKYFISVLIMAIPILITKSIVDNYMLVIFISVFISPIVYACSCILLKDDIALQVFEELKSRFIKKKILNNINLNN